VIKTYVLANPNGEVSSALRHRAAALGERESRAQPDRRQVRGARALGLDRRQRAARRRRQVDPTTACTRAFFSNVWMLPNGEIIKAVLQPINGVTWPYHLYYFDKDETSIFGEGLSAIMRDDQDMLNAAVRMMLDNGALTAGPMVEIFPHLLNGTEQPTSSARGRSGATRKEPSTPRSARSS
jgi:hypothetical protein